MNSCSPFFIGAIRGANPFPLGQNEPAVGVPGVRRSSVRRHFALYFGGLLLAMLIVAGTSFYALRITSVAQEATAEEARLKLEPVHHLELAIVKANLAVHHYLVNGDPKAPDRFYQAREEIENGFRAQREPPYGQAEQEVLEQAYRAWNVMQEAAGRIFDPGAPRTDTAAMENMERLMAYAREALTHLEGSYDSAFVAIQVQERHTIGIQHRSMLIVAAVFAASILIFIVAGMTVCRRVLRPINQLEAAALRLGDGDLALRMPVESDDELGRLAGAFNVMAAKVEENRAALEFMTVRDGLTGLYNHSEFIHQVEAEAGRTLRHGRPLSLLLLDVDHFKQVNDTYGHVAGDMVLQAVAKVLVDQTRPSDYAARYGGEEFAVLLPETEPAAARLVAERIRTAIAALAVDTPAGGVRVTASVGIAAYPPANIPVSHFVDAADRALYAAKRAGRDRVCCEAD